MTSVAKRRRTRRQVESMAQDPFFEISESVALLEQATESNSRQIGEIASTTSKAISELATTTGRQIREIIILVEKQGVEFRAEMKTLSTDFAHSRQPNYLLWISGFMALVVLIGAAYQISDLRTQVTMAPVLTKAVTNESAIASNRDGIYVVRGDVSKLRADLDSNTARDEVSEKDRAKLNLNAIKVEDHLAKLETDNQVLTARLTEIETQKRGDSQARNIQFANTLRFESLLWEKTFGTRFPSEIQYYPDISTPSGASK